MPTQNRLLAVRTVAAKRLWESGSVKVDLKNGFIIAAHQKYPDAPRSPIYFNMRKEGMKGGTLTDSDIKCLATALWLKGERAQLFTPGRPMAAIPAAGTPLTAALLELIKNARSGLGLPREFLLERGEVVRSFTLVGNEAYQDTLLVDDLVTSATTKLLASEPITDKGGSVSDILVFLHWSQSARDELAKLGIRLHAVWDFEPFMEWSLGQAYLTRQAYEAIIEYPQQLSDHIAKEHAA